MPGHKITLGLYSVQSGLTFNRSALSQMSNIKKIRDNFEKAALARGNACPEMVLSLLLIPDWAHHSSYGNSEYIEARDALMREMRDALDAAGLTEVKLENFYDCAFAEERAYLEQLASRGSNADMIKTHALIATENATMRHLQLDTNTIIHDYQGLYDVTFGRPDDVVGVNASYYDDDYVSIHNKIVYAPPDAEFIKQLKEVHLAYCDTHKDDHLSEATSIEKISKNSIYARNFTVAALQSGLTTMASIPYSTGEYRTIFPAVIDRPEYDMSQYIVTAVNMSWSDTILKSSACLSTLPAVQVQDATCDIACYKMAIKKHTGKINIHKYGADPERLIRDLEIEDSTQILIAFEDDEEAHRALLSRSNPVVDFEIIARFYDSTLDVLMSNSESVEEVMFLLAQVFPDDVRGNALTEEIFGCSAKELHNNPMKHTIKYQPMDFSTPERASPRSVLQLNCETQQYYKKTLNSVKGQDEVKPESTSAHLDSRKHRT